MATSHARVPTGHASRYLQQLCKHWSHKLEVEFTPENARIVMPSGAVTTLAAAKDALDVAIEADSAETVAQTIPVIERHLDRFAFREAPLPFDWSAQA